MTTVMKETVVHLTNRQTQISKHRQSRSMEELRIRAVKAKRKGRGKSTVEELDYGRAVEKSLREAGYCGTIWNLPHATWHSLVHLSGNEKIDFGWKQ